MMADLCHDLWACFRGENAKQWPGKFKRHMRHLVCFCVSGNRSWRLFAFSLFRDKKAKGRQAKKRQSNSLTVFVCRSFTPHRENTTKWLMWRFFAWRLEIFAPKTRTYDAALIRHHRFQLRDVA